MHQQSSAGAGATPLVNVAALAPGHWEILTAAAMQQQAHMHALLDLLQRQPGRGILLLGSIGSASVYGLTVGSMAGHWQLRIDLAMGNALAPMKGATYALGIGPFLLTAQAGPAGINLLQGGWLLMDAAGWQIIDRGRRWLILQDQ